MLAFLFSANVFNVKASAVHATVGINYSFDYSEYSDRGGIPTGNACNWEQDTYESQGLKLNVEGADEPHCLATWNAEISEGYVIYNLKAEDFKQISELKLFLTGRVFHYAHTRCKECRLEIYAARTCSELSQPIDVIYANDTGASLVRSWDLTEYTEDAKDCYVKIKIIGAGQTWVNLERIAFKGTEYYSGYKNETFFFEDETFEELYYLPKNGAVDIEPKSLATSALTTDYSVDIEYGKIGSPEVYSAGSRFSVTETGNYRMFYTVRAEDRVYVKSYDFYVVEEKYDDGFAVKNDGVWSSENLCEVKNYVCEQNAEIKESDEKVSISGQASYLLPLDFEERFNFLFNVPSFEPSGYFMFALTGKSGGCSFYTMETPGLYFLGNRVSGGEILLFGYFSDGEKTSFLGQQVLPDSSVHGIGFCRRDESPKMGLDIYFDGVLFSPYECCYSVNTDTFMPKDKVFMTFKSFDCDFNVMRIVRADYLSPVLKNADGSAFSASFTAEVGEYFEIPDLIAEDEIDGIVPFSMKITDPYGNKVVPENGKVFVRYEGRYTFLCSATDYSGNTMNERFRLNAKIKDGAPQMLFYGEVSENGRKDSPFELPCPEVYLYGEKAENLCVKVDITAPSGNTFSHDYASGQTVWTFIPEEIGVYGFIYSVSNDVSETSVYYQTNIKLDVNCGDSYDNVKKSENWISGATTTKHTDNGIKIFDYTYSALPFEMSEGIEISLDLTSLGNKSALSDDYIDCWAALAVGFMPQITRFGLYEEGFVYFMFYREDSEYFVNAVLRSGGVDYFIVGGYSLGSAGNAVISIDKKKNSDLNPINIYINHKKIEHAVLNTTSIEKITDDENFCYLSVSVFGESTIAPENFKAITLTNVSVCDGEAPTAFFGGEWVNSAKKGEKIILPQISVSDNRGVDHYRFEIGFFAPDGTRIEYVPGEFSADEEGTYYLIIKAVDDSGNKLLSVYELSVGTGGTADVVKTVLIIVSIAIVAAGVVFLSFYLFYRKRKSK